MYCVDPMALHTPEIRDWSKSMGEGGGRGGKGWVCLLRSIDWGWVILFRYMVHVLVVYILKTADCHSDRLEYHKFSIAQVTPNEFPFLKIELNPLTRIPN